MISCLFSGYFSFVCFKLDLNFDILFRKCSVLLQILESLVVALAEFIRSFICFSNFQTKIFPGIL